MGLQEDGQKLKEAWDVFVYEVYKLFRIPQIVEWLTKQLNKLS